MNVISAVELALGHDTPGSCLTRTERIGSGLDHDFELLAALKVLRECIRKDDFVFRLIDRAFRCETFSRAATAEGQSGRHLNRDACRRNASMCRRE